VEDNILRGDIFYAELGNAIGCEQNGRRPVVIVQNDIGNKHANTVIIVPLTKKIDGRTKLPTHITVKKFRNIKYDSTILAEQIRVIDKKRLTRKIGRLSENIMKKLDNALAIAIGIVEIKNNEEMSFLQKLILFFGGNKYGI